MEHNVIYSGNTRYKLYSGSERRVMGATAGTPLPYDAEIEYLRCTGTQWINTGFVCGSAGSGLGQIKIKKRYNSKPSNYCGDGGGTVIIGMQSGKLGIQWTNARGVNFIDYDTDWHEYYLDKLSGTGSVDLTTKTVSIGSNVTSTFGINGYQVGRNSSTDTAYVQLWDISGNLVFDAISVRVGQVGYMYDKVSGELFGNAGTGDFILGNDIN